MKKYEAMFIIKPDLKDEERDALTKNIKDQINKQKGVVTQDQIWAERRKLAYDIFPVGGGMRYKEGTYYLVNFDADPLSIVLMKAAYGLNEQILRYMIVKLDEKKLVPLAK